MLCSTDRLEAYPMNGAQSLIRTLVGGGVDVCFANPGTSEMHFVASLDAVPQMRAVLALFEGVVTGAADGYGRMAERPGATLLHLGPGMANGLANLHNARRAHTPIVNVIGDHALYHKGFGAPLESDIESLTGWLHGWSRTSTDPMSVGLDAAEAIAAACTPPGQIANLVVPADVSWGDAGAVAASVDSPAPAIVEDARIAEIAAVLTSGEPTVLLLGHGAARERGLMAASRIAEATGVAESSNRIRSLLTRRGGSLWRAFVLRGHVAEIVRVLSLRP
jgi:acetolactate synthase I/II/III large subunit